MEVWNAHPYFLVRPIGEDIVSHTERLVYEGLRSRFHSAKEFLDWMRRGRIYDWEKGKGCEHTK